MTRDTGTVLRMGAATAKSACDYIVCPVTVAIEMQVLQMRENGYRGPIKIKVLGQFQHIPAWRLRFTYEDGREQGLLGHDLDIDALTAHGHSFRTGATVSSIYPYLN